MKKIIALIICMGLTITMLAACSCAGDSSGDKASSKTDETTSVIATTPDGGTVEQDSDGNKITKDKNGEIVSVEDSNGNAVDVDEYIESHPDEKKSGSAAKTSSNSSKSSSGKKSNSSKSSGGSKSSKSSKSSSSSDEGDAIEGEIPTIIVDDEGIETAPELPDL